MVIQGDIKPILDFETNFALNTCKMEVRRVGRIKKINRYVEKNKILPKFTFTNTTCNHCLEGRCQVHL